MSERLFFDGKVVKQGARLIITVPQKLHHLFPATTKVKVTKE
jgi:hypothetical protein